MSTERKERSPLDENKLIDARQLAERLDRPFTNSDIEQFKENGLDLQTAAEMYVERYEDDNSFIKSVKGYLNRRNTITSAQARAVLNIMRDEVRKTDADTGEAFLKEIRKEDAVQRGTDHECMICHEEFPTFDNLDEHRRLFHGGRERPQAYTDEGEAEDVLEVTESKLGLDISGLPDGRYAAPDRSGNNDYIFLAVKRVRKTVKRDRRYVYGNVVVGNEIVVAGTIEVRIWSSDTKEWVGSQKPGDVYRGKYEEDLELIMMAPEPWAILFGRLLGYCSRCGKKLTDDESRAIGLGLECEKKRHHFSKPPEYTYIGNDRPDKEKANPLDEKYLKGELKRWVEPPKSPQQ